MNMGKVELAGISLPLLKIIDWGEKKKKGAQ
jgi:hypothetical protein